MTTKANKQALRIREVQCPNCKARFLFRRARVPHFYSSGLESCTFNCKFCRASLAGVIDPYDGALLLSVVVCAPAPGLHEAGTGRYQRQHEPIYPEAWSQSPKAPAIPSSQSRLARGGGSEKISSAATSPLDQLRGSAEVIAEKLDQLDQSTRVLEDKDLLVNEAQSQLGGTQLTVSGLLVVTVFGMIAILGTLRHWF